MHVTIIAIADLLWLTVCSLVYVSIYSYKLNPSGRLDPVLLGEKEERISLGVLINDMCFIYSI